MLDSSAISVFGTASFGSSFNSVIGGVKFYSGPVKSLIRRQRERRSGQPLGRSTCSRSAGRTRACISSTASAPQILSPASPAG